MKKKKRIPFSDWNKKEQEILHKIAEGALGEIALCILDAGPNPRRFGVRNAIVNAIIKGVKELA